MPWFKQRGDGHLVLVPDSMPETVERLRRESGWQEVPEPASVAAVLVSPDAAPAQASARVKSAPRQQQQQQQHKSGGR